MRNETVQQIEALSASLVKIASIERDEAIAAKVIETRARNQYNELSSKVAMLEKKLRAIANEITRELGGENNV